MLREVNHLLRLSKMDLDWFLESKHFLSQGNLLTRLMGPIFTIPYQAYCTRKALENVKKQILQGGNSAQHQL
jgi:hypothetical protein